jgi:hypothetical protein
MLKSLLSWAGGKPWGGWAFCSLLIAGGLGCHAIIMAINLYTGFHLGHDDLTKWAFGGGALAIDFLGMVVCSLIAGARRRRDKNAFVANCFIVTAAALSMLMFYGFNASTRILPVQEAAQKHSNELTAITQSDAATARERDKGIAEANTLAATLAKRATDRKLTEEQRQAAKDMAAEVQRQALAARFSKVEVTVAPVEETPDAMSKVLAARTGMSQTTILELLGVAVSAMLLALGSYLIRQGAFFWPKATARRAPVPTGRPQLVLVTNRRGRDYGTISVDKQVLEWINVCTRQARFDLVTKSRVPVDQAWRHYCAYCQNQGYPQHSVLRFRNAMGRLEKAGFLRWHREGADLIGRKLDWTPAWTELARVAS